MSCGDPHDTDCREVLGKLYEYLDRELREDDIPAIRQHLDECGPCLGEYGLEEAFRSLLRRCCQAERAPEQLRARILVEITQVRLHLEN